MLGQLAGQDEAHSGLDLARGHCGLLVVAGQLGGLSGNLLKDVRDEGVQDGDGPGGDTSVGVHLQDSRYKESAVKFQMLLRLIMLSTCHTSRPACKVHRHQHTVEVISMDKE